MTTFIETVLVFVAGVAWVMRRRQRVWHDVSLIMLVVAALVAVEGGIGFLRMVAAGGPVAAGHRWLAHASVVVAWCLTVIASAAAALSIHRRPVTAIASTACVVLVLCLMILESLTGYLGKGARASIAEETHIRFIVLHCVALPCFAIAAAMAGGLILRKANRALASEDAGGGPIRQTKTDNPYAAPSES